jgi:hypothetical protein
MKNNSTKNIQEEIRQFKLYKIQTTEAKLRNYQEAFNTIKQNIVIKFTKNVSSNILIIIFTIICILLFLISLYFLFPTYLIQLMQENDVYYVKKNELIQVIQIIGITLIAFAILFAIIASLLKKNIRKRNVIYQLSQLIGEVIQDTHENVKEDKKKYEYFVDSIAETEHKNTNNL